MKGAIDTLPPLRDVINTHGLSARKSLGQNFLLDLNLTAKIARQAGDMTACDVLEIGPGPGRAMPGGVDPGLAVAGCAARAGNRKRQPLPPRP